MDAYRRRQQLRSREPLLDGRGLLLSEDYIPWILNHVDCFVSQSRGNQSIKKVDVFPHDFNGHDDEVWDKVGQALL
jgi:hypothetical protein